MNETPNIEKEMVIRSASRDLQGMIQIVVILLIVDMKLLYGIFMWSNYYRVEYPHFQTLSHNNRVTYIYINGLGIHWFPQWLVDWPTSRYYLKQLCV